MLSGGIISLLVTVATVVFGLAGIMCGMVGDKWFQSESNVVYFGLLRVCYDLAGNVRCINRNVFSFSTRTIWGFPLREKTFDDIFTMLLMSSTFSIFGLLVCISMSFCFNNNKSQWRFLSFLAFLFISIAASLSLAAAGISESIILNTVRELHYVQDWVSTVAWIGAASLSISAMTSVVMFCFPPKETPKRLYIEERFARATLGDMHFNFILNKPYEPTNTDTTTETSTTVNTTNSREVVTFSDNAFNMLPLQVTSLNSNMYNRMDQHISPPRYSPTPSEYCPPPSYNEAVGQSNSD